MLSELIAVRHYARLLGLRDLCVFLYSRKIRRNGVVHTRLKRLEVPVEIRAATSDLFVAMQIFQAEEYSFNVDRPPNVLIDAGANVGLASIYFANRFPSCKIIAIEPERDNFIQLERNVRSYPNVIPIQAALWGEDGEVVVTDPGLHEWGYQTKSSTSERLGEEAGRHAVRAVTVSTLMREFDLDCVDILKIDIEGAEVEVFSASDPWIRQVGLLIVELHDGEREGASRKFYKATDGFDREWRRGENVYLVNEGIIRAAPIK